MQTNNIYSILAQADSTQSPSGISSQPVDAEQQTQTTVVADANGAARTSSSRSPLVQFLPMILIVVVMYFLLFRGPRKKQQQHKQMVQSLKKNDRVRTIGGIIGTVVDIKEEEITLKVDESNNTKIRVLTTAIGKNMSHEKD